MTEVLAAQTQMADMLVHRHRTVADEIGEMLKYYAYDDAVMLSELNYETSTAENRADAMFLYADALYQANKKEECYGLLRSEQLSGGRLYFLFARVSFDLGKIDECRGALFENDDGVLRREIQEYPRLAAHANLLHGQMLCDDNHMDLAQECCKKSLDENVFLWTAVLTYLKFGGEDLGQIFEKHKSKSARTSTLSSPAANMLSATPSPTHPSTSEGPSTSAPASVSASAARRSGRTPSTTHVTPQQPTTATRPRMAAPRKSSRLSEMATRRTEPATRSSLFQEPERPHTRATHSSRNRAHAALNSDTENANTRRGESTSTTVRARATTASSRATAGRRIVDLSATAAAAKTTQRKRCEKQPLVPKNSNLARSLSGSTNSVASTAPSEDDMASIHVSTAGSLSNEPMDANGYATSYNKFFDLYTQVGLVEETLSNYNWTAADALFAQLDREVVLNASIIRLQLGRACFEQSEYRECRLILEELHNRKRWKVEGTELLSTSLWHLQDTRSLSALAQGLTSNSRERPQSWCAAGNCFSLQRQHSQAVECMERAIQLDSRFAYAYTLLGHELIVQDELDKAAGSFRSALMLSPRDYRAWHGLGIVHLKKEQSLIALANIQKAVSINPTNRAMLCTLSQIEQQRGQMDTALILIDRALTLNPLDVACRFNKARLLFEAKRNEECLVELEKLKAGSPDEAFVFHLLARVHRRMGSTHLALLNYSWAAELDPRGEQSIADNGLGTREEYEDDEYGSPTPSH